MFADSRDAEAPGDRLDPKNNSSSNDYKHMSFMMSELTFVLCCLETMEDWDQEQLEKAVAEKHGQEEAAKPRTAIVCDAECVSGESVVALVKF